MADPTAPKPESEHLNESLNAIEAAIANLHKAVAAGEMGESRAVDPLLALRDAARSLRLYWPEGSVHD